MGFRELIDNYFFSQYSISIKITKKDVLEKLEKDVFSDDIFKSHIKETSLKLNVPEEVVEKIVKHYITYFSLLMNTIVKHKRRFVVYCFFYIDIEDNYYKEGSKYSKEFLEQKFPSISKFISKKIRNFKKVKH